MTRRYTIAVDFDGVIHSYTTPWEEAWIIPDPPVPGAIDWLTEIAIDFNVVVYTTRGETEEGRAAVRAYLVEHGLSWGNLVDVTAGKPMALLYVDDRAWRFEGDNFPTVEQIHDARPWNRR